MHKYIFTDTNLFEQFQPITDIDWLKLAGCDRITLLVPSVTVRELNEHKDGATRGRLKRKAAAVLIALKKYSDQGTPIEIRDGVELDFKQREPLIDFATYHLDPGLDDDRLIASAISFAIEEKLTPESVIVTTGDFGLQLKIKAQPLIRLLPLPDELRLLDELGTDEKRVRELENELSNLKATFPDLQLTFANESRHTTVEIEKPRSCERGSPKSVVTELRKSYPYLAPHPAPPPGWVFHNSGPHVCQQYNQVLEQFFLRTEHWVEELERVQNWYRLSTMLDLFLHNSGGAPGKDIDVAVQLPTNIQIVGTIQMPMIPAKPLPPLLPNEINRTAVEAPLSPIPDGFSIRPITLNTNSQITETRQSFVNINVVRLKHTCSDVLPRILVHWPSYEGAESFRLDYRILAANHPKPAKGVLDVIVEKK